MLRLWPHYILLVSAVLTVLDVGFRSPSAAGQQPSFGGGMQSIGVQWQHDLETAKTMARQTGRLVLIHFWTPTCSPCLKLDESVFNQPGVDGALQAQFVPVKLNANEHPDVAQSFGITHLPTDVIMSADGQVVGKMISPPTPVAYVAETTQLARQYTTRLGGAFAQAAATAPEPPKINAAYAGLQIPFNTPAALDSQPPNPLPDRYAATTNQFATNASTSMAAGWAPAAQAPPAAAASAAHLRPEPYGQTQQVSGATPVAQAPTIQPPAAQPPIAPAANVQAPARSIANPYASLPQNSAAQLPLAPSAAALPSSLQAAAAPTPAPNNAPIGFDGYCPVSMRTQWKWVPGDARYGIVHRGRTYLMAGPAEQQQFWADPDRYSPALSGMDPVLAIDHGQQVPGKREHSIDYQNMFYLFASEATLQQFTSTPERYAVAVRQAMGIQRGRLVR